MSFVKDHKLKSNYQTFNEEFDEAYEKQLIMDPRVWTATQQKFVFLWLQKNDFVFVKPIKKIEIIKKGWKVSLETPEDVAVTEQVNFK